MSDPAATTRDEGLTGVLRRADLMVLAVGLVLLLGGWLLRARVLDRTTVYRGHGITLAHPTGWILLAEPLSGAASPGDTVELADPLVRATFKPRVAIRSEPWPRGGLTVGPAGGGARAAGRALADYALLNLQRELSLFHRIAVEPLQLGRQRAVRVDFAYAINPAARPDDPAATDIPVSVRASALMVRVGDRLVQVEVHQTRAQHRAEPGLADRVLATVRVAP